MGNVYKETYNVGSIPIDNNSDEILSRLKTSHHSSQANYRKYGYIQMPIIFYKDEEEYRLMHKIHNPNIEYKEVFDRYEEFDFIETDREFKDRDIITIKDKEYSISYKFNKDLNKLICIELLKKTFIIIMSICTKVILVILQKSL
jgi:hypothetical protein